MFSKEAKVELELHCNERGITLLGESIDRAGGHADERASVTQKGTAGTTSRRILELVRTDLVSSRNKISQVCCPYRHLINGNFVVDIWK